MEKLIINSYDEFAAKLDMELGKSEWLEVDQERINMFADATLDHQWIHVDTEKAKVESPYKSTIAHGYLTLSLLPLLNSVEIVSSKTVLRFLNQTLKINNFFDHHLMVYFVPPI